MKLSALILTKNEEAMIEDCLKQLDFADEIVVLDQNSRDQTVNIAKKYTQNVATTNVDLFDKNRNNLAQIAKGEWIFYLDADERLEKEAVQEIKDAIQKDEFSAYYFKRKNFILGKWLRHGGWWPDYVPRLFKKDMLIGWYGSVHESPKVKGKFGYFKTPLVHLTGRDLSSMFKKTIRWAKTEAELFYVANHPKVTILTVIKACISEFFKRYLFRFGFLDGVVGLVEAIFQALHRSIVITYLWELQNNDQKKLSKIKSE